METGTPPPTHTPVPSLLGKLGPSPDQSPRPGRVEGTCLEGTKLVFLNLSKTALRSCAPSRSSVPRFTQQLGHQATAALPFFDSALSALALGPPLSSFPKSQAPPSGVEGLTDPRVEFGGCLSPGMGCCARKASIGAC